MNKGLNYILGIATLLIFLGVFSRPIFKRFINTDTVINKIGCRIFEFNSILVEAESGIDSKKIELKLGDKIVYRDNGQRNKIGQFYGYAILKVYYDSVLIAEIGHWKRNNWYVNDYLITMKKRGTHYLVDYEIIGPDGKNDNFQKRYVYSNENQLIRIDYQDENGEVYNTEKKVW